MPTVLHDPAVMLAARAAFALLFASAAWHKLRDRAGFAAVLAAYRVLPAAVVPAAGVAVAAVELATAIAWLVPATAGAAAVATIGLLAVYAAAIGINLARGRRAIDCGCGLAGAPQPIGEWLLVRNALLALAACWAIAPGTPFGAAATGSLVAGSVRPLHWLDALTVAGGLAVASATWVAAHGLAAAAARVRAVDARHADRHGATS